MLDFRIKYNEVLLIVNYTFFLLLEFSTLG